MRFILASVPNWFLAPDFLINAFSCLILLFFLILCIRNYRLDRNKGMLYLGTGFAFIALAQLAIVLTKFGLYYDTSFTSYIGSAIVHSEIIQSTDTLYNASIFLNKAFTLLGLYVIFRLPKKKQFFDIAIIAYFLVLSIFAGSLTAYLFHLTAFGLFGLIASRYYSVYRKNKFENTKILSVAFAILALSRLLLLLSHIEIVTVIADVLELGSYITLLVLIIKILKHGKEKEPDGYNLRHAEYHPGKRGKH
ncbi:MAG: hypothetical protein PHH00_00935 [Candidatus Nanoarchaeia archaeon]|nr:hypothetical protein [Candidatus Nanoarchaeia archaeon]